MDLTAAVCAICFEDLDGSLNCELECTHTFHSVCLQKWLCENRTCPICRLPPKCTNHTSHPVEVTDIVIQTQQDMISSLKEELRDKNDTITALQTRFDEYADYVTRSLIWEMVAHVSSTEDDI